ncbi:hypothetical protein LTR37_009434 [Vermiconidia calcicola]|uniref:Uncharacterized protein n=1 Tax=Vermiconidia calcicola TaxID=1690605 RepID=A0ACC3N8V9_9PEZI|nr:hypothetical protein LTR37_009434 [Vermiconidia calcicola]
MSAIRARPGVLPLVKIVQSFSDFASSLSGSSPDDLTSLTLPGILSNLLRIIRSKHPTLGKAIAAVAPFVVGYYAWLRFISDYGVLKPVMERLRSLMVARIIVPSTHKLNRIVKKWMVSQGMKANASSLTLRTLDRFQELEQYQDSQAGRNASETKRKELLECEPDAGTYTFRFDGHRLTFDVRYSTEETVGGNGVIQHIARDNEPMQITISCFTFTGGMKFLQEFLEQVEAEHAASQRNRTTVYRPALDDERPPWGDGLSRPKRKIDSVTLASDRKLPLIQDVTSYLSDEIAILYANLGVPLRRGYLLHGPPGTGKSSFSTALAGHFDLDVYVVTLTTPGLDDKALSALFDALPDRCVVLLEDIDSAGIQRETMRSTPKKTTKKAKRDAKNKRNKRDRDDDAGEREPGCITLSGLLNTIDGPCSKDGRILIMTSNTPDSLDPALVRPGRIDMKTYFGNASTEVLIDMFKHVFTKSPSEPARSDAAQEDLVINDMANHFAADIPSEALSPAEIQGYLMIHRNDPAAAVENAAGWAAQLIETKARGANVSAANESFRAPARDVLPNREDNEQAGSSDIESEDGGEDENDSPPSPPSSCSSSVSNGSDRAHYEEDEWRGHEDRAHCERNE